MTRKIAITSLSNWNGEDCEIVRNYKRNNIRMRPNGYSIAEILLVFGIIAGVLVGVWAMYSMLSSESDAKKIVTEIQLVRAAVQEYRTTGGAFEDLPGNFESLQPYVGAGLEKGVNGLGHGLVLGPGFPNPFNSAAGAVTVALFYPGIADFSLCAKALQHFGQIRTISREGRKVAYLVAGTTVSGYLGGGTNYNNADAGCFYNAPRQSYDLKVHLR